MPSVKEWASSLRSSRRSSLVDPSTRRSSQVSLSMDSDSEPTLIGSFDVEDLRYPADQDRRSSTASSHRQAQCGGQPKDGGSIERRVDYCVVEDDRYSVRFGNYTGVWAGNTTGAVPQTRSRYFGDHIHQHAYNTNKS